MAGASATNMTFHRYGRSYQLRIENAEDLAHLLHLDEAHWMATSAPIEAFACDPVFLKFLDTDKNDRIRSGEVRAAVEWLLHSLANRDHLGTSNGTLRLDDINLGHDEGQQLRAAAERILNNLRRPDEREISLSQVRDTQRIFAAADANGDGIIPPGAARDPGLAELIKDVIATVGGDTDASGQTGITEAKLAQFLEETAAYLAWRKREETERELMPLGPDTAAAYGAFTAIREKIDEYFHLYATVAYDPGVAQSFKLDLSGEEAETAILERELRAAPVAPLADSGTLNLDGPLNPAYTKQVQTLKEKALAPVLKQDVHALSEAQWRAVSDRFAAHAKWQAEKPDTKVASLDPEGLKEYLESRFPMAARGLIEADQAAAAEVSAIGQVEKLILYQRWLLEFVNNFVSFPSLYDPEVRALFETGTLIMDGRQFTLCVKVDDRAEHAKVAKNSRLFVLYVELTQTASGEKREVAAGVTAGGMGNLYVGKHGIFFDREDRLWDARVTQLIENPISLAEALMMPFRRIGQLIQSQVERFAGSGQQLLERKVSQQAKTVTTTVQAAAEKPPPAGPAQAAPSGRSTRELLVGGSLAISALGASFAYIVAKLQDVSLLTAIPKVLCLILLVVLLPILINAWVKLRLRDMGTLLEACSWAINGRVRLTRVMQGVFTRRPELPPHATKDKLDRLRKYRRYAKRPFVLIAERIAGMGKDAWDAL